MQIGINGEPHFAALSAFSDGAVGRVRRQHRHRPAARRHGFGFGRRDFVNRRVRERCKAIEHPVSRGARSRHRAVRPSRLRRLRQRHQQRRFAERQPPRLFAKIGKRSGTDPLNIAAIGREFEIKRNDLIFRQYSLDFHGAHDLMKFRRQGAAVARLKKPCHLHGQRRAAGANASAVNELDRSADERQRVDAGMLAKPPSGAGPSETIQDAVAAPPERQIKVIATSQRRVAMDHLPREQALAVAVISRP